VRYPSPDHNRATPKPIPLKNASVGEAFPTTSVPVHTRLIVRTKKSEPRLICEKDLSPLPHWKLSGTMCRQPSHTTRATCTSERKTNVRSTSSQTKLAQSVSHSFWVNVAIMIAYRSKSGFSGSNVAITQVDKMNSPVVMRGRPRRGRPATLPVSLRRRTRRSLVETFTPISKQLVVAFDLALAMQ
jgi:hypothetical protein